ncbi:hypothetical protein [Pedobacter jejuensis]|uniref:SGNH/GDSL hydrolase family protein n=1 Tax=Pedobacter jejuensis TaxID=1268550 RepID=A0A3N0BW60_9SPHI|nr:hypothetical protein [Pedobacter jejuensis]RNL53949.1 hypothetical protein D7004_07565 [Pedobacter jejuensis]
MKIFKITLKTLLVIAALLLIGESVIRLRGTEKLQIWSQCNYQADSILGYRYKPNSSGILRTAGFSNRYQINGFGFTGKPFQVIKRPGTFRIIVVGASDENGINTNGPLNYVGLLEKKFRDEGRAVEVINMAIDGKNFGIRNVRLINTECLRLNPDLILFRSEFPFSDGKKFRTTYKDIQINYFEDYRLDLSQAKKFIDQELLKTDFRNFLFNHSYLYRYFVNYYIKKYQSQRWLDIIGTPIVKSRNKAQGYARKQIFWCKGNVDCNIQPVQYTEEETIKMLKDLTNSLAAHKAKIYYYSFEYAPTDGRIKKIFEANHLTYFEPQIAFKTEFDFGTLDGHASQQGHKAFADALFKSIRDSVDIEKK